MLVALAVCLSGLSLPGSQGASKRTLTVGVVADQEEFHESGCELLLSPDSYSSERYVFMSHFNGQAVMNIDGHDLRFKLVRSTDSQKEPRKGDRSRYWYASGSITVEVDYTVTGICPPDDESCEVIYYRAIIHISSGPLKKSIVAHGLCGS
jgi:hypothetical protein